MPQRTRHEWGTRTPASRNSIAHRYDGVQRCAAERCCLKDILAGEQGQMQHTRTRKVELFDTSLRDGLQQPNLDISVPNAVGLLQRMAAFGVRYAEIGFAGANQFVGDLASALRSVDTGAMKLALFGRTRGRGTKVQDWPDVQFMVAPQGARSGRGGGGQVATAGCCEVAGDDAGREPADGLRDHRVPAGQRPRSDRGPGARHGCRLRPARERRTLATPISASAASTTSTRWWRSAWSQKVSRHRGLRHHRRRQPGRGGAGDRRADARSIPMPASDFTATPIAVSASPIRAPRFLPARFRFRARCWEPASAAAM